MNPNFFFLENEFVYLQFWYILVTNDFCEKEILDL